MGWYNTLPVTVEAHQWDGSKQGALAIVDWVISHGRSARYHGVHEIYIDGDTGALLVEEGDWIIRDNRGKFFIRTAEAFNEIYQPAASQVEVTYQR